MPSEKVDINQGGPSTLLQHAHDNDNLLGMLPKGGDDEIEWACVLPLQQPSQGEAVFSGMNAPFVESWKTLDELDADELAPNMRFVIHHLEHDDAAVGFNYSQDPRMRVVGDKEFPKFKPNSWDHFHMHWLRGVHEMTVKVSTGDTVSMQAGPRMIEVRPHRYLNEMLSHVVEASINHAYGSHVSGEDEVSGMMASVEKRQSLPFTPDGGVVFMLPVDDCNELRLGTAVKAIHEGYLEAHKGIWEIFVSNYGEVRQALWQNPYNLRSSEEIDEMLGGFTDNEALRKGMKRYFDALRPEADVPNSMNWLYRGPSYSMALYRHEEDYVISLLPHLMHPTNWLAALGMFEARQGDGDDFTTHRDQARHHMRTLGSGALALVDHPPYN